MPPQIFITGATGYIGGDFLQVASENHPDWQFVCLVRTASKASTLVERYPNVRIVHGDLDAVDMIASEAAAADVVYNFADCDHVACAQAIAKGVARNRNKRVCWIHTSGTGILTFPNFASKSFGHAFPDEKVYDDWDGVGDLTSLPDKALHRHVDKIVLGTAQQHHDRIRTAIVCPPAIYGIGRGTSNNKSKQVYIAANLALKRGKAMQVGDGSSIWHGVHINDLSQLFLLLGEAALSDRSDATWNDKGYYLVENGDFTWGEITQEIADEGQKQGYLSTNEVESLDFEQAQAQHPFFPYLCGTTSRGVAKRAGTLLGWKPMRNSLKDEIPRIVSGEAKALGLEPK